jgi:Tol biopolymer transport system component
MDRTGTPLGDVGEPGTYLSVALSPDERRAAIAMSTGTPPNLDVWSIDMTRGFTSRLTFDPAAEVSPVWAPDSSRIVFQSQSTTAPGLHAKQVNAATADETVLEGTGQFQSPAATDWSRDGRFIAFTAPTTSARGLDIWMLPLSGDRKPFPFVEDPATDDQAVFSPDGRWVAYMSNESGQPQVYLRPFPAGTGKLQVSKSGGSQPVWRADGKELFFLAVDGTLMAAPVATISFELGTPQSLFRSGASPTSKMRTYAVSRDGKRFLVVASRSSDRFDSNATLTVVVNWLPAVQK